MIARQIEHHTPWDCSPRRPEDAPAETPYQEARTASARRVRSRSPPYSATCRRTIRTAAARVAAAACRHRAGEQRQTSRPDQHQKRPAWVSRTTAAATPDGRHPSHRSRQGPAPRDSVQNHTQSHSLADTRHNGEDDDNSEA